MNNPAFAFDWNQVRAFFATAEAGSFSAAARALGLTQPTVGRQVAALEESLGVLLFERVGRSVALTRPGHDLMTHVRAMAEAANGIAFSAAGQAEAIAGQVRITASDVFSTYMLPPLLKELRETAPGLEIDVVASNDIRDLMRREADIAVRHVRPSEPDLIARKVAEGTARFYAARSYLDRCGRPANAADLANHTLVHFGDPETLAAHFAPLGFALGARNFPLGSESGVVAWQMVRQGLGIAIMDDIVAGADPGVEAVLKDMAPVRFPVWLVSHRELQTSARIRLVFDRLADYLDRLAAR